MLNIVGEGNASATLRDVVARNQLESIVRFSGWLKVSAVESVLAESDVLVLPSWSEGLPNVIIEAMAARLAVVVCAVGNVPDVVTDGREVLLVPPQNIPALKSALVRVIDDPALRRQLGDVAYLLAERQFGVEQVADRILMVVSRTIIRFSCNRYKQKIGS